MGNHRSKTAKIRGFHLALNTLLGLNEVTYSLPITYHYSTVFTGLCWVSKSDRISCNKGHECVPQWTDWAAVQILDIDYNLPSPMQVERLASVFQHWVQTYSREKISRNGLLNHTVRKVWTVLAGNKPVDIRKERNSWSKTYTLSARTTLIHSVRAACYGQDEILWFLLFLSDGYP